MLAVRRELPAGPVESLAWDEDERWLRARRGRFELVCNFGREAVAFEVGAGSLRLATDPATSLDPTSVCPLHVAPLSGALLEEARR